MSVPRVGDKFFCAAPADESPLEGSFVFASKQEIALYTIPGKKPLCIKNIASLLQNIFVMAFI